MNGAAIAAHGLAKRFGPVTALDGVSAVGLEDTDGDALYAPLTANDLALTDPATDAQS